MKPPATLASAPSAESGELDALLRAISDAIEALVAWDPPHFRLPSSARAPSASTSPATPNGAHRPGATADRAQGSGTQPRL